MPEYLQGLWDMSKDNLSGGFPYSEGIYEDINKVICTQFYWQKDKKAVETIREYISFYYSPSVVDEVSRAIAILDKNLERKREDQDGVTRILMTNTEGAEEAFRLIEQADKKLASQTRASWRWRILYLRALIDNELSCNQFRVSERCNIAFKELSKIYRYTEQTAEFFAISKNILGIISDKK